MRSLRSNPDSPSTLNSEGVTVSRILAGRAGLENLLESFRATGAQKIQAHGSSEMEERTSRSLGLLVSDIIPHVSFLSARTRVSVVTKLRPETKDTWPRCEHYETSPTERALRPYLSSSEKS